MTNVIGLTQGIRRDFPTMLEVGLPLLHAFRRLRPSMIEWLCLVAGSYLVFHYSWLLDDAYVYFRYVDNLLYLNLGLVNNEGEYVEGFSSPCWAIWLIILRATGLNYWFLVRAAGMVCFWGVWLMLVVMQRRLAPSNQPHANLPLCFVSFAYGPLCYFTSGLESPLVQATAVAYALFVLNPGSIMWSLAVSLSPLVRQELAATFVLAGVWSAWRRRKIPWVLVAAGVIGNGAWLGFRIYYYADLLPNTFYLKDTIDVAQGFGYLRDTFDVYGVHFFVAASFFLLWIMVRRRQVETVDDAASTDEVNPFWIRERLAMLVLSAMVMVYVVKIGGDPRHYRFLAFPALLVMCAGGGVVERTIATLRWPAPRLTTFVMGSSICVLLFAAYPRQLFGHPFLNGVNIVGSTRSPMHMAIADARRCLRRGGPGELRSNRKRCMPKCWTLVPPSSSASSR